MNRRIFSFAKIIAAMSMIFAILAMMPSKSVAKSNDSLSMTFDFGEVEFTATDKGYNIMLDGANCTLTSTGKPQLPARSVTVAIPKGKCVSDISVTTSNTKVYKNKLVEPAVKLDLIKLTEDGEELVETPEINDTISFNGNNIYNESVYSGLSTFPEDDYAKGCIMTVRGFNLYTFTIYPLTYTGTTLTESGKMKVTLSFADSDKYECAFKPCKADLNFVNDSIDDKRFLEDYIVSEEEEEEELETTLAGTGEVNYVVITSEKLKNSFEPLLNSKRAKGLIASTVTTEAIYANYDGYDNPERIRNFIKDAYEKNHITYVLLGGDADNKNKSSKGKNNSKSAIVPARCMYVPAVSSGEKATYVASDVYYSNLDGDFDHNKNHKYGESSDGVDGGEVDWAADIYVGRAPVDNIKETKNFVTKTVNYDKSKKVKKALMVGELLSSNYECSVELASELQTTMDSDELTNALRDLRDVKIAEEYVDLYYDSCDYVKGIMLNDLSLLGKTANILGEYVPVIEDYMDGKDNDEVFTDVDIANLKAYCKDLKKAVSKDKTSYDKKDVIISEITYFDEYLSGCNNKTFKDIFEGSHFYNASGVAIDTSSYDKMDKVYGGTYKDEIRKGAKTKGSGKTYKTKGFKNTKYKVTTLYDKNKEWKASDIIKKLNASPELINHMGHANTSTVMRLKVKDVKKLKNKRPFFLWSQGCYAGSFDNRNEKDKYVKADSILEEFVVASAKSGAVAAVGNSRYGWYSKENTNAPTQLFDRAFWEEAIRGKNKCLGACMATSKTQSIILDALTSGSNKNVMRYSFFEINLLGDPEIQVTQ